MMIWEQQQQIIIIIMINMSIMSMVTKKQSKTSKAMKGNKWPRSWAATKKLYCTVDFVFVFLSLLLEPVINVLIFIYINFK